MSPRLLILALVAGVAFLTFFLFEDGHVPLGDSRLFWTLFCLFNGGLSDARRTRITNARLALYGTRTGHGRGCWHAPRSDRIIFRCSLFSGSLRAPSIHIRCPINLKGSNLPQRRESEAVLCYLPSLLRCAWVSSRNFGHLYPYPIDSVLYTRCRACQSYTGLNRGRSCRNG